MKKFLTVLLVIAVMFTFSFGSAFAADVAPADRGALQDAAKAYKNSIGYTGGYLTGEIGVAAPTTDWAGAISQTVLEAAIDEWVAGADLKTAKIDDATGKLANDTIDAMVAAIKTKVEENQYAIEVGKLRTRIDTVRSSLSDYNATGKANLNTAIGTAEQAISTNSAETAANAKVLKTALGTLEAAIKNAEQYLLSNNSQGLATKVAALRKALDDTSGKYYDSVQKWFAVPANITGLTATQVAAKDSFNADFNALVAYFDECIDRYYEEVAAGETPFAADTAIDTAIKAYFEDGKNETNIASPVVNTTPFQIAKSLLSQKDVWVTYYEKAAVTAKTALNADGTKKYYDADVEKLLADTKDAVEKDLWAAIAAKAMNSWGSNAAAAWNLASIANNNFNLQAYKKTATDKFTTANDYKLSNWSGARADKVEALQDEYAEKILLAETVSDIDALVKEAKTAIDAIMKKADVDAVAGRVAGRIMDAKYLGSCTVLTTGDDSGSGTVGTAAGGNFSSYFDVVVGPSTTYKAAIKNDALKAAAQVFVDAALETENKNITYKQIDEIIAAKREAAYAALTNVKSTTELNAEAAAVAELIKALPSVVTTANKEQVLAAQAAMDAYVEHAGAKQDDVTGANKLKAALTTIMNTESRDVSKLIREIPLTVTVADADKIAAARAAYDAFYDAYGDYEGTAFTSATYPSDARIESAEKSLETAKLEHVAKLITALNSNSTKAQVEAVKAAFDDLTTLSKLTLNDELYTRLMNAVSATAGQDIEAVQALKIKASSSVKKGSITVKWTVKGDTTAVEGYEIWKSTKKSSGFKKAFTTKDASKQSYKNTKGLKKGTRYYYKVRAIAHDAAGNKVTSDWSNKAYRVAK